MNAKVRPWHLVAIAAGVGVGVWLLLPSTPKPPNFTNQGFTSVRVEMRGSADVIPALSATSNDPAVIAELAEVLRSGESVVVCRCAPLGSLEFSGPDGTTEKVLLMPAHDGDAIEFRVLGSGRFRVNREWFLRVVAPLGLPAARWHTWPDA